MINRVDNGLVLKLKIVPNSSKNELIIEDSFIKLKLTAQPIENKANIALVEFLSNQFKVPKSKIKIIKGNTSKDKTILIETSDIDKISAICEKLTKH